MRSEYGGCEGIDINYHGGHTQAGHDSDVCKEEVVCASRCMARFLSAFPVDKLKA